MNLSYRMPRAEDEALLRAYVQEHYDNGETSISASLGLPVMPYGEWVASIRENERTGNEFGRSLLYLCFEGEKLIGLLSVRFEMPGDLAAKYGHIGYGVRPSERRRGFATEMTRCALEICREKGLRQVILGCYADNTASARTIEKCGGVLFAENDNYKTGRPSRYYTIEL